ncbi:hypothetical protein CCACVL1_20981 [Corchorus capsularis]|uniref:Purine permease 10 n=1 Tax=Corchorus capsularis TaxID=210143 RepID=A0A1R3H907_COCAP|nr:hypothetical protein CCACVL1_20981 [Corchorus capsularis]
MPDSEIIKSRVAGHGRSWLRIGIFTILALCGQTSAVMLTRLYYVKGGNSNWVATLVQILVGFKYLPVSTMTLILASQLAFNAFFSYFLNSQNFTPFITNSLVLLTTSSLLLVESDSDQISGENYATGFICTIFAAATCALLYASQQLAFRKFLKRKTFEVVMDVLIYRSLVAAIVILMFFFGTVALIFEVSSLFSNVIGSLGLPINPIIAMFVFNDKMDYMKGISMGLAIWGVISYVYQQYLDHGKLNAENKNGNEVSNA